MRYDDGLVSLLQVSQPSGRSFLLFEHTLICICIRAGNKEAWSNSLGLERYEVFERKEGQIIELGRKL